MNRPLITSLSFGLTLALTAVAVGEDARIRVRADRPGREVSRYMTGACIEDVNHEIYGGLYSQMVFGESFQEPPATAIEGFTVVRRALGRRRRGSCTPPPATGRSSLSETPSLRSGEVSVQVCFPDDRAGTGGADREGATTPAWGTTVSTATRSSLDPSRQALGLGRHRHNWEPIRNVPCDVPVDRWIDLAVRMTDDRPGGPRRRSACPRVRGPGASARRRGRRPAHLAAGGGLPPALDSARTTSEALAFTAGRSPRGGRASAGCGGSCAAGRRAGSFALETERPLRRMQSQRITFEGGDGAIGVENQGLNRWGMNFVAGKPYEGYLWIRADEPAKVYARRREPRRCPHLCRGSGDRSGDANGSGTTSR